MKGRMIHRTLKGAILIQVTSDCRPQFRADTNRRGGHTLQGRIQRSKQRAEDRPGAVVVEAIFLPFVPARSSPGGVVAVDVLALGLFLGRPPSVAITIPMSVRATIVEERPQGLAHDLKVHLVPGQGEHLLPLRGGQVRRLEQPVAT